MSEPDSPAGPSPAGEDADACRAVKHLQDLGLPPAQEARAANLFQDPTCCTIFLCLSQDARAEWVKQQLDADGGLGSKTLPSLDHDQPLPAPYLHAAPPAAATGQTTASVASALLKWMLVGLLLGLTVVLFSQDPAVTSSTELALLEGTLDVSRIPDGTKVTFRSAHGDYLTCLEDGLVEMKRGRLKSAEWILVLNGRGGMYLHSSCGTFLKVGFFFAETKSTAQDWEKFILDVVEGKKVRIKSWKWGTYAWYGTEGQGVSWTYKKRDATVFTVDFV